jgi:hypothetical protein
MILTHVEGDRKMPTICGIKYSIMEEYISHVGGI